LLSLAWVLIGYFSLFDLGLGRALTKLIAERRDGPRAGEIDSLTSTGLALMAVLGLGGGLLVAAVVPFTGSWLARLEPALRDEAQRSMWLIALSIPLVVVGAALRSVLEGMQAFRTLNLIRGPAGALLYAVPAIGALWTPRLDVSVLLLLMTRLLITLVQLPPCLARVRLAPQLVDFAWSAALLRFGGWLTVSNIVGPVIVYVDRFVLGALLSVAAMGYYSAPFEIVTRLLWIPAALAGAMFPALAQLGAVDAAAARALRGQATRLVLLVTVPLCVLSALLARPALGAWLGPEFAEHSTAALLWLLPGFALNSLAQIPVVAMQGQGRTRAVALLHLCELPLYFAILWLMTRGFGIAGAACAWSLRAGVDYLVLSLMLRLPGRAG
jgi:O-antigen/teichoic acid export membrane protein